jgi:hypothetical protein
METRKKTHLQTRHENKNNHEITFEEEKSLIQNLNLDNDETRNQQNEKAKINKLYGRRVSFLLALYGKTAGNLSLCTGYSTTYIHNLIENRISLDKVPKNLLSKIAFYFEIEESFFTEDKVKIILTEQNKIEYVKH